MSDNDHYFSRNGELFRYTVLSDECQVVFNFLSLDVGHVAEYETAVAQLR